MSDSDSEVVSLTKLRRVFYDTYANLPMTNVDAEDLGYATDTQRLYRWSGAAWQAITPDPATFSKCTTGTYSGNGAVNRAVAHNFGSIPKVIIIVDFAAYYMAFLIGNNAAMWCPADSAAFGVTAPTTTNFYVGNNSIGYLISMNDGAHNYVFVALG